MCARPIDEEIAPQFPNDQQLVMSKKKRHQIRSELRRVVSNLDERWLKAASGELCTHLSTLIRQELQGEKIKQVLAWTRFFPGEVDLTPFIAKEISDFDIFLDLKLHDIPNTVAGAIKSLEGLPIDLLTIHISGGEEMLKYAHEARLKFLPQTKLIGVTYLTSLSNETMNKLWGFENNDFDHSIEQMLIMTKANQIDGIVCSPLELKKINESESSQDLIKVCPGVRFPDQFDQVSDQKRVATPTQAFEWGANFLVIGRPLTQAQDPGLRWRELAQQAHRLNSLILLTAKEKLFDYFGLLHNRQKSYSLAKQVQ